MIIYAWLAISFDYYYLTRNNAFVSRVGGLKSSLGPVKSITVLPTDRHRGNISLEEVVLSRRNDAKMGPANSLHASA